MPTVVALRTKYSYSRATLRYRNNLTGQWVKAREVKRAVNATIASAQKEMRLLASDMAKRRITLGQWQERFAAEIKNLHVSNAMAGAGGMGQMAAQDYGRVGQRLRFEYERLAKFAADLKARKFTENELYARVEMYIAAGNVSYEGAKRDGAIAAGYDLEKNVLGKNENHCTTKGGIIGCVEVTALGKQPIGTLPAPGYRRCISRCYCMLRYYKAGKAVAR